MDSLNCPGDSSSTRIGREAFESHIQEHQSRHPTL